MQVQSIGNNNYNRNNQSFGMAVKITPEALETIHKRQINVGGNDFIESLKGVISRQKSNPVDIHIAKDKLDHSIVATIYEGNNPSKKLDDIRLSTNIYELQTKYLAYIEKKANEINSGNKIFDELKSML